MKAPVLVLVGALAVLASGCYRRLVDQDLVLATTHEARSFLGEPLDPPAPPPESAPRLLEELAEARAAWDADPGSEDATIWLGRRLAYLGRYRDAIDVYTRGIAEHPESYRLRRHRGHRFLTVRQPEDAIADLTRAAELAADVPDSIEPDGAPNAFGIPTSTRKSNIYYHLGLAHFVTADFESALAAYRECMTYATTDDMRAATAHWLVLTLERLGRAEEAARVAEPFTPETEILENHGYHACLLLRRGLLTPAEVLEGATGEVDFASRAFGVAGRYLALGDEAAATSLYRRILEGESWMAFGYLAAEAELARRRDR